MRALFSSLRLEWGRAATLTALILVQALCAIFFIVDAVEDVVEMTARGTLHLSLETAAAMALSLGVVVLALELRRLLDRQQALEEGMMAARGAMAEMIDACFLRWGLTPAEREVGLFALKGLDNESIAALRGAAVGTVRAQTARVYAKAGVSGRAQLMSLFIEELLAEPLSPPAAAKADRTATQ
jgi:DNA-binding CsgD family transcriptional regulator